MRPPIIALLSAAVVGSGCGSGERPAPVVRDSAGIRIVENDRPAWSDEQRWRVGPEPSVDIGRDSAPAHLLNGVRWAQLLSDGRIAVLNGGTADVRLFNATGRHLATIGGRGQGPGDFVAPSRVLELGGDSLLVLDNNHRLQFTLFGPDGRYARAFTVPLSLGGERTDLLGWFPDGSSLVRRHELDDSVPTGSLVRQFASLFRLGNGGIILDSLGLFPGLTTASSGPYMWGPIPHAAVHDTTIFFGPADSYEVRRYSWNGALSGIVRLARPSVPTTEAHIEAFWEEGRKSMARWDPRLRAQAEKRISGIRFAPTLPAYHRLETDAAGNLWVQEYARTRSREGRVWTVFDPAGAYLGDVEMPDRFTVHQFGDDFVLGTWRDADDVEHVRMYPIVKPR
jgi:hypothetical protein